MMKSDECQRGRMALDTNEDAMQWMSRHGRKAEYAACSPLKSRKIDIELMMTTLQEKVELS
jgi:hypothetical protein